MNQVFPGRIGDHSQGNRGPPRLGRDRVATGAEEGTRQQDQQVPRP